MVSGVERDEGERVMGSKQMLQGEGSAWRWAWRRVQALCAVERVPRDAAGGGVAERAGGRGVPESVEVDAEEDEDGVSERLGRRRSRLHSARVCKRFWRWCGCLDGVHLDGLNDTGWSL